EGNTRLHQIINYRDYLKKLKQPHAKKHRGCFLYPYFFAKAIFQEVQQAKIKLPAVNLTGKFYQRKQYILAYKGEVCLWQTREVQQVSPVELQVIFSCLTFLSMT
ncbi:MAG: hypothetical protein IKM38_06395, partial [Christensenellaceae bacterium]|nr:hypothetical protein [Christensenellaceae bacterium]